MGRRDRVERGRGRSERRVPEISWDARAQLIWGQDLEIDNTVLARMTVTS
ncbi:hypothetical protein DVS28_a2703 [Euzebya pacifica]|uniref:Uncharacterized protein n=1 Tax=Euzebya pacifica TaxID=1608957 RepID=A0A346XYT5_9ACTN|nr:hypothetical protein DVS28_a2703 [Euzebya pacifica]